jgi:hypothetical protein
MMKAANDTTVAGRDFAAAVHRILPTSRKNKRKDLGGVTIALASPGVLRLTSFYASVDVPAEGTWTDAIAVSGRFLWNLVEQNSPLAMRLVYFDGTLTLNSTSITASTVSGMDAARKPRNRLIR